MTTPLSADRFSRATGLTACIVGGIALVGWFADIEILRTALPNKTAMAAITAPGFMLMGIAIWLQASPSRRCDPGPHAAARRGIAAAAGMGAALGLITLASRVGGFEIGYEQWRLPTMAPGVMVSLGRMAGGTSLVLMLLGGAILVSAFSVRHSCVSQSLALLASVMGLLASAGYLYDARTFYGVPGFASMSLPAAFLTTILGIGTLALEPRGWLMAPIVSARPGGVLARHLLPAAIVVPLTIGWLRLQGERLGYYGTPFGLALFASANVLVFVGLTWWNARQLNSIDLRRDAAAAAARDALSESEQRYRRIAESLPQLVWTCDPDGECDYLSPQWRTYTGVSAADQLVSSWSPQVLPGDLAAAEGQWKWSMKSGDTFDTEVRIRRADGVYRWFRTLAVPLRDETGRIVKWFGTNTDIDDRKRAEAELQQLTIALEYRVDERTRELRIAKEQAESADRLKTDFIMTMSHELRTPLNGIIGFTRTLLSGMPGPLTEQQERQLRVVQASGRQLLLIISDVLDVAQIEAGSYEPALAPVDAAALVRVVATEVEPLAREKQITIVVDAPASPVVLHSDERALRQVLMNLASNAIKFTSQGTVTISAAGHTVQGSPIVELSVADTGIGIASSDRARLFTKFGRLKNARQGGEGGTGLGLYLSRRIVGYLNGSIELESEPDRGSRFVVRLPAARGEV